MSAISDIIECIPEDVLRAGAGPDGCFTILQRLGKTSLFGQLYLARDACNDELVALKFCEAKLMAAAQAINGLERPLDEVRIMQYLQDHGASRYCPILLNMISSWHDDKQNFWIATEFAEGGDAFDYFKQLPTRLDEDRVRELFLQVVFGTQCMHAAGVVHLDLSLENLFFADKEHTKIKIADFGMARRWRGALLTGQPGKLSCRAPEMFRGEDFDGRAADVYALGHMLFTMLTRMPAYGEPGDVNWRYIQQSTVAELFNHWKLPVSDAVNSLVCGMMHTDPRYRLTLDDVLNHPWFKMGAGHVETKRVESPSPSPSPFGQEDAPSECTSPMSCVSSPSCSSPFESDRPNIANIVIEDDDT